MSIQLLISAATLYFKIGVVVALAFVALVGKIDKGARGAFTFRPLLIPGATLLWPLVLTRSLQALLQIKRGEP